MRDGLKSLLAGKSTDPEKGKFHFIGLVLYIETIVTMSQPTCSNMKQVHSKRR